MKIRIAVAVANDGSWYASSWGNAAEHNTVNEYLADGLPEHVKDGGYHVVYVEADVPLPSNAVVPGTVVEDKK